MKKVREPISALNRIKLVENNEELVDLRVFVQEVVIVKEQCIPWVRKTVALMLREANRLMPNGNRIGVREAWRSRKRQKLIYDRYFETLKKEKTDASYATLRRLTNRFFAPYDQPAPPGHSTGGAIDVALLNSENEVIPLDGEDERFKSSATFYKKLKDEVIKGRMMVYKAMIKAGFSNCHDEWWHYSYGDAAWAVRTGKKECMYGEVFPPEEEYLEKDKTFEKEFIQKSSDPK